MLPNAGPVARPRMADARQGHSPSTITIVLAGGALSRRKGLLRCFSKEAGFVLVRCSNASEEALSYCQKLIPCVLIVDQDFAEKLDPVEFGNTVGFGKLVQTLVLAPDDSAKAAESFLRMGCMGVLPENASFSLLRRAARGVAAGQLWAPRRLVSQIVQDLLLAEGPHKLTRREQEILKLIAQGYKNREIAQKLFITRDTVRWHVRSLYAKAGVQDRLSLAFYALEQIGGEESKVAGDPARRPPATIRSSKLPVTSTV